MKTNQNNSQLNLIVNIVIALISILLLFYSAYRAAILTFIIDESISYNLFVPIRFIEIIIYTIGTANNHMINSICLKVISMLFGSSEFLLRFPSLISHIIYIVFTYMICRKNLTPIFVLGGFIILNANPYMLDFFSSARGYSMVLAFLVVSVYYLLNYIETNKKWDLILSLIGASFAVLCNFTLLIYFVAFLIIINIYWITTLKNIKLRELLKKNTPNIIAALIITVLLIGPISILIKNNEFYDGGTTGFWQDTVSSLVYYSLYGMSYSEFAAKYIKYFIAISLLLMLAYSLYAFYKKKRQAFNDKMIMMFLILLLTCFVSIFQHFLMNSKFLINRMALFFVPLFFISVLIFLNKFTGSRNFNKTSVVILFIIAITFSVHTINSSNTAYFYTWKYNADVKKMLVDLDKQRTTDGKASVKLGIDWLFEPSINFYKTTKKYDWLEEVSRNYKEGNSFDYYYVDYQENIFKNDSSKIQIKQYSLSNTILLKQSKE